MKRKFLTAIAATYLASSVAFAVPFSFSLRPYFAYSNGSSFEYLFLNDSTLENQMTSELIWPQKDIFSFGLQAEADINGFAIHLDGKAAIPKTSGQMLDSDWFDQTNIKQGYSISENYLNACYDASIILEKKFEIPNSVFILSPEIGFQYKYLDTSALEGGKGWYDWDALNGFPHTEIISWDSEKATYMDPIPQVDYKRHSFIPWIGGTVQVSPWEKVHAKFSGLVSPYVYVSSQDHHYYAFKEDIVDLDTTGSFYNDRMNGNFCAFNFGVDLTIDLSNYISLYADFNYFILNQIKGKTYEAANSHDLGTLYMANSSGCKQNELAASVGLQIKFSNH